ncbi:MAG TPA: glycosyltransferase family 2 protein [Thermoanaerobaculia bacterium]|nr:glycosyltransferase family 2 protein [Thermoanaerobaculia bacterium]
MNWNSRDDTLACLAAVSAQARAADATITVVDNGSTDGSIGAVKKQFPDARLLPLGKNFGFTGGLAAALKRSPGRNVIFLNNDAIPEDGWLSTLVDAIERADDDVVSVGGKIVDPTGKLADFIGGVMTFDGHAFQKFFRYPLSSAEEPKAGADLLFACGGNMISRRDALLALGGFDDDYFAYLEDVDFGWRTWISGRRATYEPRAVVRHKSSATSNRLGDFERGVLFERNALQTVLKNAENLRELGGAALFAFLARLRYYVAHRNKKAHELTRAPMTGKHKPATIDDPLTAMQFRALECIFAYEARIAKKRAAVQRARQRTDAEIFARFPLHVVPTYAGDEALMASALFRELLPEGTVAKTLAEIMRPAP